MEFRQKVRSTKYLLSRGGLSYCILLELKDHGMISTERFVCSKACQRFFRYFTDLPQEDYEKEIREQFDTVLHEFPDKYKDNPETFNEKIQWMKVHDVNPLKTRLADKYLVRDWIKEQIGGEYLIPLVGGPWKSADEIDFDSLPDRFALKANHGCGMNLIVKDKSKLDIPQARSLCNSWLNTVYGCIGMETQYFHIPPVLIAEQYMEDESGNLNDYKVFNFHGEPKVIQVDFDRFSNHHRNLYSADWEFIKGEINDASDPNREIAKPETLNEMLEIAKKLSKPFAHVRTDFYLINNRLYFGEMTFSHGGGTEKFKPEALAREFGGWLKIVNGGGVKKVTVLSCLYTFGNVLQRTCQAA